MAQLAPVGHPLDETKERIRALERMVRNRAEIIIDGGFRSGSDVAAALCLGARFVLVGRAFLYGLMADGERGVDRVVELLSSELRNTMQLLGAPAIENLNHDMARLPG